MSWSLYKRTRTRSHSRVQLVFQYLTYLTFGAIVACLSKLPYAQRVALGGVWFQYIVSPISGSKARISENIEHVLPNLGLKDKQKVFGGVPNNIGRTFTELFFPDDFLQIIETCEITGEGYNAFKEAQLTGQPVILVAGHFGNYDSIRGRLVLEGHNIGSLYKPLSNPFLNRIYVSRISKIGFPLFPNDKDGMRQMIHSLQRGETIALMADQAMSSGTKLPFMGRMCNTPISAAKLATKYGALLIPCLSNRNKDGITHTSVMKTPIKHTDPVEMTKQLNFVFEQHLQENIDQWLWTHRRWKGYYQSDS